jgi:hypothetical protein
MQPWAVGESQTLLFQRLADVVIPRCGEFGSQQVSNFLWAYVVADIAVPSLCDSDFICACLAKRFYYRESQPASSVAVVAGGAKV